MEHTHTHTHIKQAITKQRAIPNSNLGSALHCTVNQRKGPKLLLFCKGDHLSNRKILLRNHKRCFSCLNQGHITQFCLSLSRRKSLSHRNQFALQIDGLVSI